MADKSLANRVLLYTVVGLLLVGGLIFLIAHNMSAGQGLSRTEAALWRAIHADDGRAAASLLSKNPELLETEFAGESALNVAVRRNSVNVMRVLLDYGADVNRGNEVGETPLHLAAGRANAPLVEMLMAAGADVNLIDCSGLAPLDWASDRSPRAAAMISSAGGKRARDLGGVAIDNAIKSCHGNVVTVPAD